MTKLLNLMKKISFSLLWIRQKVKIWGNYCGTRFPNRAGNSIYWTMWTKSTLNNTHAATLYSQKYKDCRINSLNKVLTKGMMDVVFTFSTLLPKVSYQKSKFDIKFFMKFYVTPTRSWKFLWKYIHISFSNKIHIHWHV